MHESDFDWQAAFLIPAGLRLRLTPAGALQVDGEAGDPSVEVAREWVDLFLGFARPQAAEAAFLGSGRRPDVDRASFSRQLAAWAASGLLRVVGTSPPAPSRLGLFARAAEEFIANPGRRFPLRSQFELQRPLWFYPGLETREIHERSRFPWVATLESAFPVIQEEFTRLLAAGGGPAFATVHRPQTSAGEWAAAYLVVFGKRVEETCRHCPETVRALGAVPGVAEFGTTLYSAIAPRTQIAPHHGVTNAKLRCQLPLRVPGGCKLKVGEHEVEQQEGRCIVFDDSFLHSAWNDGDEPRFVLVFDFFHPDLTAVEIGYLTSLAEQQQLARPFLDDADAGRDQATWVRSGTRR